MLHMPTSGSAELKQITKHLICMSVKSSMGKWTGGNAASGSGDKWSGPRHTNYKAIQQKEREIQQMYSLTKLTVACYR